MPFRVFIPDFPRRFEAAAQPRLPALERMVARATRSAAPAAADFLAPLYGLEPRQLAPAPFMYLADSDQASRDYRLCAEFVHLAPDRDQLVYMPGSLLEMSPDESAALAAAFNGLYGTEGWVLELLPQGRAYLRCPRSLEVSTTEPDVVTGCAVLGHMPQGADAAALKQLMNESQMLFHTHAVNRAREDEGRPLINSLWLWGGGVLPAAPPAQAAQRVVGDLPLLRGLGLWSGNTAEALDFYGHGEIMLGSASMGLSAMEQEWFAPLFAALKGGDIEALELYLGGLGLFRLSPGAARHFWRRPRTLARVSP